jgi:hypothetical protein
VQRKGSEEEEEEEEKLEASCNLLQKSLRRHSRPCLKQELTKTHSHIPRDILQWF